MTEDSIGNKVVVALNLKIVYPAIIAGLLYFSDLTVEYFRRNSSYIITDMEIVCPTLAKEQLVPPGDGYRTAILQPDCAHGFGNPLPVQSFDGGLHNFSACLIYRADKQ
jgi:hypothetical protein